METGFIERYWHGYLLILKPLLVFMNLKQIRILFQLVFALLLCSLSMMLYRRFQKVGAAITLSFVFAFTLFGGWKGVITLPIFFSFAIAIAASLWACRTRIKGWSLFVGFAFVGAMTVYFDYLDNPLSTLCLPLVIILTRAVFFSRIDDEASLFQKERFLVGRFLGMAIVCCVGWLIGYALFWGMKWVLVDLVTGSDVFARALDQAAFRVGVTHADDYGASPLGAVKRNVGVSGGVLYYLLVLIVVAAIGWCLLVMRVHRVGDKKMCIASGALALSLVLLSLFPYLWIAVLLNHSQIHAAIIVYRTQLIAYACWFLLAALPLTLYRNRQEAPKERASGAREFPLR